MSLYGAIEKDDDAKCRSLSSLRKYNLAWSDNTIIAYKSVTKKFAECILIPYSLGSIYDMINSLEMFGDGKTIQSLLHEYIDSLATRFSFRRGSIALHVNVLKKIFSILTTGKSVLDDLIYLLNEAFIIVRRNRTLPAKKNRNWMSFQDMKYIVDSIMSSKDLSRADIRDAAFIILMFSGRRVSEVQEMDIDDIIFSDDNIFLNIKKSKTTDSDRIIPLPNPSYHHIIRKHVDLAKQMNEKYVLCSYQKYRPSGKRLSLRGIGKIFNDLQERHFGMKKYSTHDMRRGFVTEALSRNIPLQAIKDNTLHTSDRMLMKYRMELSCKNSPICQLGF